MLTAKEAHEQTVNNSCEALATYCETEIYDAAAIGNFSVRIKTKGFESTEAVERVLEQLREAGYGVLEDPDCEDVTEFEIQW